MERLTKLERYRGCLLAGGVGDQLGNDPEFMLRRDILREYGPAGVRRMSRFITDDTQMTLFTAEGMLMGLKHGTPMPECVYQSYLDWYATQMNRAKGGLFTGESGLFADMRLHHRRAPGNTCLNALGSGRMGRIDAPLNDSKGCGGVMRTAPCGMLRMVETTDPEDAYALQGAMAGAITHSHAMGWVPAAMLADMVHMILLEDGRTLRQITLDSLARMMRLFSPEITSAEGCEAQDGAGGGRFAQMLAFREMMRQAVCLAESDVPIHEAIARLGEGWVGDEALAIAVCCVLRYPQDMEECLSAAVTHDGDSDSTGAIAGNILGAWLGVDAIPECWLSELEMREVIDDMALRLYRAGNK